jgi:hypothetical protein
VNKPHNIKCVLRKTWDCWSPGTELTLIEYTDIVEGEANSALVRIKGEQVVIPLSYITERRR